MEEKQLHIYFTSDLHSYIFPTDYRSEGEKDIGLFKCANKFKKDGNTLIIDGGDILQGSPLGAFCHDSLHEAQTFAEMMNCCGYDYVTLGNHDFNYGTEYLNTYLNSLNANCVCQNVTDEDGLIKYPARIHILENGLQVGIVGIITDYVNVWERKENLHGVKIGDPFAALAGVIKEIKAKSDITVCIYHGGFERDLESGASLSTTTENIAYKLCKELDIDILLTGHQHMTVQGQYLFGTYVVQPGDMGRELINVEVSVSDEGKTVTSSHLRPGGTCDEALLCKFAHMEEGAQHWLDEVVGELSEPMMPADHLTMALHGNPLPDFFNLIQLRYSKAQISAASLANEVTGIPKTVHRRDVLNAYPYANTFVVLEVTGEILKTAMERSASYFDYDAEGNVVISDRFLRPKVEHYNYDYYSGVDYEYDISKPVGERVVKLKFRGMDVKPNDTFSLCLNSYRASGTGGYDCYVGCPVIKEINTEMVDLILEYFKDHC